MKEGDIVTLRHNWNKDFYGQYGIVYYIHSDKYWLFKRGSKHTTGTKIPHQFQYITVEYEGRITIGFPRTLLRRVEDGTKEQLLDYALWKMKQ